MITLYTYIHTNYYFPFPYFLLDSNYISTYALIIYMYTHLVYTFSLYTHYVHYVYISYIYFPHTVPYSIM